MKYVIELNDELEIETLQELAAENNMTPSDYLMSLTMTFIHKRLRGKLLEQAHKMTVDEVKARLKEGR